jgi:hypothetical protein
MTTVGEYIKSVKDAHAELGFPELDPYTISLLSDAWHKATKQERERCAGRSPAVVAAILDDLTDRRGLRHEWEYIESDIQKEIINAWEDAADTAIREGSDG